jgi:membrane dipeptidase
MHGDSAMRAGEILEKSIIVNSLDSTFERDFDASYMDELRKLGITAVHNTIARPLLGGDFRPAVKRIDKLYEECTLKGVDKMLIASTCEDILRAKAEGKVAIILGLQSPRPIEEDLSFLRILHRLGLRILQLTYQYKNSVGDGCGERTDCGLSRFGIQMIEEMNRIGVLIDLSHVGFRTSMEAMEISKKPMIFSHSNARAVCDYMRNLRDEQIKALAEKGGVIGWCPGFCPMIKKGAVPTMDDAFNHIDYIIKLAGINHVGIGLDLPRVYTAEDCSNFMRGYPEMVAGDFKYTNETLQNRWTPNLPLTIIKGLLARGYSDQEVEKILGLNHLRVFKEVWGK